MIRLSSPNSLRYFFLLKVLEFITSVKSLLPCKVTPSQVLRIRMWTSLGSHYFTSYPQPITFDHLIANSLLLRHTQIPIVHNIIPTHNQGR